MLAKDLFKIESRAEVSNDRLKSLVLLYLPLIGESALALYEFLYVKGTYNSFEELGKLLNTLNYSIDKFDDALTKLNEYKLVKTLKSRDNNYYIFEVNSPLLFEDFIKDNIFVRNFILKTSTQYYQALLANNVSLFDEHKNFEDITTKLDINVLKNWSKEDEKVLEKTNIKKEEYDTLFDINRFLKDVSVNLLPLKYRTYENLHELAKLADVYSISYEKMKSFMPHVASFDGNEFDLKKLKALCEYSDIEYRSIPNGKYDVSCVEFLMNMGQGKRVTPYDKETLHILSTKYNLRSEVINVLIEYVLKSSDNRLIRNYIEPLASDLNRNDIKTAKDALNRLNQNVNTTTKNTKQIIPTYNESDIASFDQNELNELIRKRGTHD